MATGNELLGISYDDVMDELTFDFGYGSAFGFSDLLGDYTNVHIHGDADSIANFPSANGSGGVQAGLGLNGSHTASGTRSGRITGVLSFTAAQETLLFDNKLYVNIHSQANTGGEIRAQLIAVSEPSRALLGVIGFLPIVLRRRR